MVSRNIYFQLLFRIVLITLTSFGLAYFIFHKHYISSFLLLVVLIAQTAYLIRYVNHTNRKIAYFFDAIKNEDFTLRFPEKLSLKSLEELNHSLNMLNRMIQDIHLKKQTQEQYYQEILKQADIGIVTFNKKGHIIFSNPTVERLLNHRPLNHIKQLGQVDENLYALFETLKPFDRKLFQLTNERERRQLALKATAITFEGEELLLVVIQDIHKELDEKETDSWVRLIRVLTHEIMNTIAPITSISESLLKYFKPVKGTVMKEKLRKDVMMSTTKGLEVIHEQGKDLISFVQSYRSLLNVPEPDREIIKASKLLGRVHVLMGQHDEQAKVTLQFAAEPENLELFIDEKQISQVLVNLAKNALHSLADSEQGIIKITAGINREGKKYIEVWDNGPGIPDDIIEEIFVPFFTTKHTGTGIGLSLSKQIMRLHGGSLKVHSVPNHGTSFVMTF
jgi:nitrogen fixation/metabolism regulation signal transduction histidine kinase